MTNVSHHCPPTTAAITWPGSRTYVVYAPAMTQLVALRLAELQKKKKQKMKRHKIRIQKMRPRAG